MMADTVLCFISVIGGHSQNTRIDFALRVIWHITLWNRELVIYQTLEVYNTQWPPKQNSITEVGLLLNFREKNKTHFWHVQTHSLRDAQLLI